MPEGEQDAEQTGQDAAQQVGGGISVLKCRGLRHNQKRAKGKAAVLFISVK